MNYFNANEVSIVSPNNDEDLGCAFFKILMHGDSKKIESFVGKLSFNSFCCYKSHYDALKVILNLSIYQNAAAVEVVLQNGADINQILSNRETHLHKVARNFEYEIVEVLINYGINIEARNSDNATALNIAKATNMTQLNKHSRKHENSSAVSTFVYTSIDKEKTIKILENAMGCSFIQAIISGIPGEIEKFADQLNFNIFYCGNNYFNAMELIMLSDSLNANAFEIIAKNYNDINKQIHDNYTHLHMAASYQAHEIVEILIKYGCDITLRSNTNKTALDIAKSIGVKKTGENTWTYGYEVPLFSQIFTNASINKDKTIAIITKAAGCYLYNALIDGNSFKIEQFVDQLNFNRFYCYGIKYNAMDVIMNSSNLNTIAVKTIVHQKAFNINKQDVDGNSYLHKAAFKGWHEIVEILIKGRINVTLINDAGKTALDIANQTNIPGFNFDPDDINTNDRSEAPSSYISIDRQKTIEVILDSMNTINSIKEKSLWDTIWEYLFDWS